MSTRRRRTANSTPATPENYWQTVLEKMGLVGPLTAEAEHFQLAQTPTSQKPLSDEMEIFITRVAEKVARAPEGITLTPEEQMRLNRARQEIKDGLRDVLNGKASLGDWFTKTKQQHNLKSYELAQIMYESLDGLKSREAQDLKEQWFQFLVAEKRGYGLA